MLNLRGQGGDTEVLAAQRPFSARRGEGEQVPEDCPGGPQSGSPPLAPWLPAGSMPGVLAVLF